MKTNRYIYETSNQSTKRGYFNIYQGKNGYIYLQMGKAVAQLTEKQINDLHLNVYELIDFCVDDYRLAYDKLF